MREKPPKFIREFSRENSPDDRDALAHKIKAQRAKQQEERQERKSQLASLESGVGEQEEKMQAIWERLQAAEKEIDDLSLNGLRRIMHFLKLRKLRSELFSGKFEYSDLQNQMNLSLSEKRWLEYKERDSEQSIPKELRWEWRVIQQFYEEQRLKWRDGKYTQEEMVKYFDEEFLASLSLKDYQVLLSRFPQEMVTHVTRQGVRDHAAMMWHSRGVGEYANGFKDLLADGRLRSAIGRTLVAKEQDKAIANLLILDTHKGKEKALEYLDRITSKTQGGQGTYSDRSSVHFAVEEVADTYYGAERGNEIFLAYPAAMIASQYFFSGQLKYAGDSQWNDAWVWANEERGIDLDAGIIFIPADAQVDEKTGSRYELGQDKAPVVNKEYEDALLSAVNSNYFLDFAEKVQQVIAKAPKGNVTSGSEFVELKSEIGRAFGIHDPRLVEILLRYGSVEALKWARKTSDSGNEIEPGTVVREKVKEELGMAGIYYRLAQNPVSSKEYWEKYFSEHPELRPSKIVYYTGGDPSKALNDWRKGLGLHKQSPDKAVGFHGNEMREADDPRMKAGMDRFRNLALKVIEDYYA